MRKPTVVIFLSINFSLFTFLHTCRFEAIKKAGWNSLNNCWIIFSTQRLVSIMDKWNCFWHMREIIKRSMESPETPFAPTLFRHHQQLVIAPTIQSTNNHASRSPDLRKAPFSTAFVNSPSTSRACIVEPVKNNVPDRPEIFSLSKRKSYSAADIFCIDNNDVRFRQDDLKPQKSIVVESNYDYTPKRADELKLKRGSTIKVIRRDGEEGWWYGETMDGSGKKGFFPQNHVQLAKGLAKEIDSKDIQFTGLLGAGGFSVVKSAIYKGREVAVKIPHSKFSEKEILEAVREESSIFQMLDHENIVEMYGVIVGDEPALVLEFCHDSLAKICSSKKNISLSEEIIGNWGAQVARGMNYLHSLNVLHRDLKAANVLIKEKVCDCLLNVQATPDDQLAHSLQSRDGICQKCGGSALNCLTLKIADLGLSKKLRVADCRMSVVGTVPYLAPEVIRDRKCSKAMDVWSFGLVLWEVLTGATPFEGLGLGAVQLQIGTFKKPTIPSSCPLDLKKIIDSCWRDEPLERPTFKELIVELEKFGSKFQSADPHDQKFLENSLHTLRKSMMEEISALASEMARKAEELQKREEVLKKGERELELKKLFFELQQTLSERPPKEKPQPPKRRQHLKCEDISKPYDLKTEISFTRNIQMIKSRNGDGAAGLDGSLANVAVKNQHGNSVLNDKHVIDATLRGFATLPRTLKKLCVKNENFDIAESHQQRVPSKSTPDLLKLYRPVPGAGSKNASPKLKRVNACKIKRSCAHTSSEEEVDERCVEVVSDKDLESLLENSSQQQQRKKTSVDHLATPRRIAPLPPAAKKIGVDHHVRSSSAADERPRSKLSREEDRRFFRFFKREPKDRSPAHGHPDGTLPKSSMMSLPVGSSSVGSSIILKVMTPSKLTTAKSPTKPLPSKAEKKKKHLVDTQNDKYDLTENSRIFVKRGERRVSATPSQSNTVYPISNSPMSVYSSSDDLSIGRRAPYEKLSEASDPVIIENPSYIPPKHFSPRDRASSATTTSFFSGTPLHASKSPSSSQISYDDQFGSGYLGVVENSVLKKPYEMKAPGTTTTQITLDSPVEGGLEVDTTKRSCNSLDSDSAPSCEGSSCVDLPSHGAATDYNGWYVPLPTIQRNMLNVSPRLHTDEYGGQTECLVSIDVQQIGESTREISECPPDMQAPTLPALATLGHQPQRPYTLDLNCLPTPTESGISTAGSSYRSLSSADHVPQDHAPPPPFDYVQRLAPPIPPRVNVRRPEDETVTGAIPTAATTMTIGQRQRLSPVSQSP